MIALLLDHLWQSSIFAGGAGLLTLALRRNSANARFWLWFAASVKFLVPFAALTAAGTYLLTPITPPLSAPPLVLMEPVAQPFSGPRPVLAITNLSTPAAVPAAPIAPATTHLDPSLVLLALWAIGFAAISVRWMIRWWRLRLLLRDAALSPFVAPIAVKFAGGRLEPGLVGIFRPVILLPKGIEQQILQKGKKALVIYGTFHFFGPQGLWGLVSQSHPGAFIRVTPYTGYVEKNCSEDFESQIAGWPLPALATPVQGTTLATQLKKTDCHFNPPGAFRFAPNIPQDVIAKNISNMEDESSGVAGEAFLYLGPAAGLTRSPTAPDIYLDSSYRDEIAHHNEVRGLPPLGDNFESNPASPVKLHSYRTTASPGTEAALRQFIDSIQKGRPNYDGMIPSVAANHRQMEYIDVHRFQSLGSLKSLTFVNVNSQGMDVYSATFELARAEFVIPPLSEDGKIGSFGWRVVESTDPVVLQHIKDNKPSSGTDEALRRQVEALENGHPDYEAMTPALAAAVREQTGNSTDLIKKWGPLKSITFNAVGRPMGNEVFDLHFEHHEATGVISPLTPDGKIPGLYFQDSGGIIYGLP